MNKRGILIALVVAVFLVGLVGAHAQIPKIGGNLCCTQSQITLITSGQEQASICIMCATVPAPVPAEKKNIILEFTVDLGKDYGLALYPGMVISEKEKFMQPQTTKIECEEGKTCTKEIPIDLRLLDAECKTKLKITIPNPPSEKGLKISCIETPTCGKYALIGCSDSAPLEGSLAYVTPGSTGGAISAVGMPDIHSSSFLTLGAIIVGVILISLAFNQRKYQKNSRNINQRFYRFHQFLNSNNYQKSFGGKNAW